MSCLESTSATDSNVHIRSNNHSLGVGDRREGRVFCSFIYAENTMEERRELWGNIKSHQDSPMFKNKQWIFCC